MLWFPFPALYWIRLVRNSALGLFLILEHVLSPPTPPCDDIMHGSVIYIFHYGDTGSFHIWVILGLWGCREFYQEFPTLWPWSVRMVSWFLPWIYFSAELTLIDLHVSNCSCILESFHSFNAGNENNLIIVYDHFIVLLTSICEYLLKILQLCLSKMLACSCLLFLSPYHVFVE